MDEILDKKSKEVIELKSNLNLIKSTDKSTYVFLVVSCVENSRNDMVKLSCKQMMALAGYPDISTANKIKSAHGGYVYDGVNDSYIINCIDFIHLGIIPFYYKLMIEGTGNWSITTPIPEKTLNRVFTKEQKDLVAKYKTSFDNSFYFNFVQFLIG